MQEFGLAFKKAGIRALNRTASKTSTYIKKEIIPQLGIDSKGLGKVVTTTQARQNFARVSVVVSGRKIDLMKFKPQGPAIGKVRPGMPGVTVMVEGQRIEAPNSFGMKAFFARPTFGKRAKKKGVYVRPTAEMKRAIQKRASFGKRTGLKNSLARIIRRLFGPSIAKMMRDKGMQSNVTSFMNRTYAEQLQHQITAEVKGFVR